MEHVIRIVPHKRHNFSRKFVTIVSLKVPSGVPYTCTTYIVQLQLGEVVGHLKEFREQQESGKSDFALPGGQ